MYKAILFDLDGTLLPMEMDAFTTGYFRLLAQKAAPYGYEPKALVAALWKGVGAMVKNDGSMTNDARFWQVFAGELGQQVYDHIPVFDAFYSQEFQQAVQFTRPNPRAKQAVALARQKAERVILATNPLFPAPGVRTRLGWIDLTPESFDAVTTYENSSFCKPNPAYYQAILSQQGLQAADCLMIGNDEREDMRAARQAGLDTFLVTDCVIRDETDPYTGPQGDFSALLERLNSL